MLILSLLKFTTAARTEKLTEQLCSATEQSGSSLQRLNLKSTTTKPTRWQLRTHRCALYTGT